MSKVMILQGKGFLFQNKSGYLIKKLNLINQNTWAAWRPSDFYIQSSTV